MTLSTAVRDARRSAGLSQAELAERAGTTQSAIARLESGRHDPRVSTLDRVLRACRHALEVTPAPVLPSVDEGQLRDRLALAPADRLARFQASQRELRGLAARARRVT